jgi:hypothetical protein
VQHYLAFAALTLSGIALCFALWKLPYSPRWLASKGRDIAALESLSRLRLAPTSDPRVQAEWITIRAEALRNREVMILSHPRYQGDDLLSSLKLEVATWGDMFKPGTLNRTLIGIMLMFFQQFVGINAVSGPRWLLTFTPGYTTDAALHSSSTTPQHFLSNSAWIMSCRSLSAAC